MFLLRIDWNGITEDICAKSKMESKATGELKKGQRDLNKIHRRWGAKLRREWKG